MKKVSKALLIEFVVSSQSSIAKVVSPTKSVSSVQALQSCKRSAKLAAGLAAARPICKESKSSCFLAKERARKKTNNVCARRKRKS